MNRGPYKHRPRLIIDPGKHQEGDIVTLGAVHWGIRTITGQDVTLEAMNTTPGILWHTTLDHLPAPTKERP